MLQKERLDAGKSDLFPAPLRVIAIAEFGAWCCGQDTKMSAMKNSSLNKKEGKMRIRAFPVSLQIPKCIVLYKCQTDIPRAIIIVNDRPKSELNNTYRHNMHVHRRISINSRRFFEIPTFRHFVWTPSQPPCCGSVIRAKTTKAVWGHFWMPTTRPILPLTSYFVMFPPPRALSRRTKSKTITHCHTCHFFSLFFHNHF